MTDDNKEKKPSKSTHKTLFDNLKKNAFHAYLFFFNNFILFFIIYYRKFVISQLKSHQANKC